MQRVRAEYTVMPRFGFHQPLDYLTETWPVKFDPVETCSETNLPCPGPKDRMGYAPESTDRYLEWGKSDAGFIKRTVREQISKTNNIHLLDFGCSSGRVLRHFEQERCNSGWKLYGVDVQAAPIQWMREYMPSSYGVFTCTTIPHLPFKDETFDVVYGFSVFTHIKYNWDMWLMELRRIMKPGGVLIISIHSETAWEFYHQAKDEEWVKSNHAPSIQTQGTLNSDYMYFGDICVSQVFWKKEVAREYFGRYFEVIKIEPPFVNHFQDFVICRVV